MAAATAILKAAGADFEVEGEMHADAALSEALRARAMAQSGLSGAANLFLTPNADAAHIALGLLKTLGGGIPIGPIMMGAARPAHVVSQSVTVRGLLNMIALAAVEAQGAA